MRFLRVFWAFTRTREKYWRLPIAIMTLILGGLMVFAEGSAVAPFI